jgi:HlyD family secretion protein
MTANVRIVVDTRDSALKVPNAALRFRPASVAEPRAPGGEGGASGGAQAPGSEAKGGPQAGEALRQRLVGELGLNAEQQAKLDEILRDTRERIRSIQTEDKAERRRQSERMRAESRARIAEILDPDQRKRYEEMAQSRSGEGRAATAGRAWVIDDTGKPRGVDLRLGLSDGTYTEVLGGALQEGSQVIVGTVSDKMARAQPKGGPRFGF